MPITFKVGSHDATPVGPSHDSSSSAEGFLNNFIRSSSALKEILQTSLEGTDPAGFANLNVKANGLVNTIVDAYNMHQNIVIRPDDVWIAILGQLNFYVNAHAEELRSKFVEHEGKKKLTVTAGGNRYTVDFGKIANQMTKEIDKNVVDKELTDWILPSFSTTTYTDTVVCAVMLMATLKEYFQYRFRLLCGIPSITLEGSKSDWEQLLSRIDKLESFGTEPKAWASMLRPILNRFITAFNGSPDIDFWSRICHYHSGGSGPRYISGWITAFCVWNPTGIWQGPSLSDPSATVNTGRKSVPTHSLDGAYYTPIDSNNVPPAHCEVDVELDDNGEIFDCSMVAGLVGNMVEGEKKDTLRPLPAWFIYIKGSEKQGK